ncbi:MAG: alpha/beta fold hydrolase [Cecembia sp.]
MKTVRTFVLLLVFAYMHLPAEAQDTLYADAGGFKLQMVKIGSGDGPIIIMENGMGGGVRWGRGIVDSLAHRANVVTYARAFLGESGKGNTDRSGDVVANELKLALQDAGIQPPYIMVGHSLGGYYIKAFARANPDDVKGLLLIDPLNTEDFYRDYEAEFPTLYKWEVENEGPKENDYEGIFVFGEVYGDDSVPTYIPAQLLIAPEVPDYVLNKKPPFGSYKEDNINSQKLWVEHQLKWASNFPNVTAKVIEGATHHVYHNRLDAVLEAFDELIKTIKN